MRKLHDCVQCMEKVLFEMDTDNLIIAGREFRSRLMVGTGKFPSAEALRAALHSSQAEIVTVALRRVNLAPGVGAWLTHQSI